MKYFHWLGPLELGFQGMEKVNNYLLSGPLILHPYIMELSMGKVKSGSLTLQR